MSARQIARSALATKHQAALQRLCYGKLPAKLDAALYFELDKRRHPLDAGAFSESLRQVRRAKNVREARKIAQRALDVEQATTDALEALAALLGDEVI